MIRGFRVLTVHRVQYVRVFMPTVVVLTLKALVFTGVLKSHP